MDINKDYRITSSADDVILQKRHVSRKGKTKGEEYFEVLGYYRSIKNALKAFVDMELLATGMENFDVVIAKIDELHETIAKLSPRISTRA